MRTVRDACEELVGRLKTAGFSGATIDPEELSPPGAVWVQPREITRHAPDVVELLVWLYVLAPNTDTPAAMTLLDDGLAGVLELDLDLTADPIDLTAAVLTPGNPTAPLPAYRVALTLDL